MHQPDSAAEARARKMAHPAAMLPRRGSSSGGGGAGLEEFPPVLLLQTPPPPSSPAAASSAGPPPPPPPQSLSLPSQPTPPAGPAGAQLKKKSGFQITSVTPAQISASLSSNNSIAEDTESYDDLDESHTEDFSSSEILDVSLSRATDLGEPERSSSEETLSNFQEVDSPGAVSPNQPRLPQQPPSCALTNGSIHPSHGHHYPHHPNGHHSSSVHPGPGGPPSSPSFRKLPGPESSDGAGPGSTVPSIGTLAAATVAHFRPGPTSAGGGSANSPAGGGFGGTSGRLRRGSKNLGGLTSAGTPLPAGCQPGNMPLSSGSGNGSGVSSNVPGSAAAPATAAPSGHLQPAASTSRFRVVKLDSSSEPFKKGRWTCTEFYDKENAGPATEGVAALSKASDVLEVSSERELTSGSSVSSTLSHYTESMGSGEMGVPSGAPPPAFPGVGSQQMDFGGTGSLQLPTCGLPQSVSQPQLSQVQFHPQDVNYSPQKQGVPPPVSAVPPVNLVGGHQPALASQQLPFAPPTQTILTLPVASQPQPLPFGQGPAQHPSVLQPMPMQMASGHVKPVTQASGPGPALDYTQPPAPPQQILPTPAAGLKPGAPVVGMGVTVPPIAPLPIQTHGALAPTQPVAPTHPTMPAPVMNVGPHGTVAPVGHAPTGANPIASSVMGPAAVSLPSQGAPVVPAGNVHPGPQGAPPSLPQPLSIALQSTLIPGQPAEPLVQAMPPVSPIPSVSTAPVPGHPAGNGPLSMAPSKNAPQPSGMPTLSQPPLASGILNLPAAPTMPLSSAHFTALALAQSIPARPEDGKRPIESTLGLLPLPSGDSSVGPSPGLSDRSVAASLFPLKVLPLTSQQLLDGEEDSSSGASVVAIDNKIEQAMDLVKSHLMYAVREEVEVLKEQIKELVEKNTQLEQENNLLKTLASPEQLAQFQAQLKTGSSPASSQPQGTTLQPSQPTPQGSGPSA